MPLGKLQARAFYAGVAFTEPLFHKDLIDGALQRWFYMNCGAQCVPGNIQCFI